MSRDSVSAPSLEGVEQLDGVMTRTELACQKGGPAAP